MIYKDISGKKMSYSLLAEILQKKAVKIFSAVLESGEITRCVMPLDELAVCCTAQFEDSLSVQLLQSIEQYRPGTLKSVHDRWGRNLLWYAVMNRKTIFFHPYCRLTKFLLQSGCDPQNSNQLGLSWKYMIRNLNFILKERFVKWRHSHCSALKQSQPLILSMECKEYDPDWLKNL